MIRLIFDSDQIGQLPRDAMAATYSDLVPAMAELANYQAQFPHGLVLIDRGLGDPTGAATVLDVESGAHRAGDAPGWYDRKRKAGHVSLTVYASRSTMPEVDAALGDTRHAWHWYATLDGTMHITGRQPGAGPAVVQFATAAMLGFHADCSVVWNDGWHPSRAPAILDSARAELGSLAAIIGR